MSGIIHKFSTSDIKQYEPLWGSWYIDEQLGEGSFGKVYKVHKEEFGKNYEAAVKIISIPQNQAEVDQARNDGIDEASLPTYFRTFVVDIVQEIDFMSMFKGNTNIVSIEEHKVIEKSPISWDVLIRMELLTTLSSYMNTKSLRIEDVIQIGIDISRALELCAVKNMIHRDIKPDNIFVSPYGDYKLGDFGIARQVERTMSGLSKKGTYTYMAPEVFKGEEYGPSVDLYSLGIVMYRYLNNNRTPFLPPFPDIITPADREEALRRRMSGEALPDIPGIDPELNAIVLKACAYKRSDRYEDATEFRTALENFAGIIHTPAVEEAPPKPAKSGGNKRRPLRKEDDSERTTGVFSLRHEEPEQAAPASRPEVPAKIVNVLSILGALCSGVLTLLSLLSGDKTDIFVSMPIYAMCVVECVLNFRHSALNLVLIVWLVCHLAFSALMNFSAFDYTLLAMTLGILAVESLRSPSPKYKRALSIALVMCSLVLGVRIYMSSGASVSPSYHALLASVCGIPLLMVFTAVLVLLPGREDGKIIAVLTALQTFGVIAFLLLIVSVFREGANQEALYNIANACFVGFSPERFTWWRYARFTGLIVQVMAALCVVLTAAARMMPEDFLGLLAHKKKAVLIFALGVMILAAGIYAVSLM